MMYIQVFLAVFGTVFISSYFKFKKKNKKWTASQQAKDAVLAAIIITVLAFIGNLFASDAERIIWDIIKDF